MTTLLALLLAASPAAAQEDSSRARPSLVRPGGLLLFYDATGPLNFLSTPGGLPPGAEPLGPVRGKACQHGLAVPLSASLRPVSVSGGLGDGGFRRVLERIRTERPGLSGLYDVQVDIHRTVILGIYRRHCVEVSGRGFASS